MDFGSAVEPMQRAEPNRVMVEYWLQYAPNGALLGPHLAARGLLAPEVASIGPRDAASILFGVRPSRNPLKRAGLVNDPLPRDHALLARRLEQAIYPLHIVARHRGDQPTGEEFVSDAPAGD